MNNNFENQENVTVQQSKSKTQGKELLIVVVALAVIGLMIFIISSYKSGDNNNLVETNTLNFHDVYSECGLDYTYATVGSDGSYLKIEAEKPDRGDYTFEFEYKQKMEILSNALSAYKDINRNLGLPESLDEKIGHTSGLDGKQTEEYDKVKVTWSYNSSNGLMILYERK